jgi:soluble lytic murein transglycosylase-like protein
MHEIWRTWARTAPRTSAKIELRANINGSGLVACILAASLSLGVSTAKADWPASAGGIRPPAGFGSPMAPGGAAPRLAAAVPVAPGIGLGTASVMFPSQARPQAATRISASVAPFAPLIGAGSAPGLQCRQAIRGAERAARIPDQLMAAIGRVESGRPDAAGVIHPWPWTINAEGIGQYFQTKVEAMAAVRALQARGVKSIDVGCMQVNLMFHPAAFASLEQAFDPAANAAYAARYLNQLFVQAGTWVKATANYHSATPDLGDGYQRRVAAVLPEEMRRLRDTPGLGGNVWSVSAFTANAYNAGAVSSGSGSMLSNRADQARLLPVQGGIAGRGLDGYRSLPVPLALRPTTLATTRTPM